MSHLVVSTNNHQQSLSKQHCLSSNNLQCTTQLLSAAAAAAAMLLRHCRFSQKSNCRAALLDPVTVAFHVHRFFPRNPVAFLWFRLAFVEY